MKIFSDVSLEYMHKMGKADCQVESDKEENRGKKYAKQKHLGCKKSARPRRNSIVNESATKSSDIR